MRVNRPSAFFLTILCFESLSSSVFAATPEFAIAATKVTMPASGMGSSSYTVSAIPMTGTLVVSCQYSGPVTHAQIPNCSYGPIAAIPVTQGQNVSGKVLFYPPGVGVPETAQQTGPCAVTSLALAGALLLGLRRRARGWLTVLLLAAASLAAIAGFSACTGSMSIATPGTYSYTITAENSPDNSNVMQGTSTTIQVTVP